jgi:hypothetical protein
MSTPSLQHKTVRPGSLVGYSYYHSGRTAQAISRSPQLLKSGSNRTLMRWGLLALVVLAIIIIAPLLRGGSTPSHPAASQSPTPSTAAPAAAPVQPVNHCSGNKDAQLILVNISQRRLWACKGGQTAYESAVITGIATHASTVTPTGTYHIYAKHTKVTLTGSDETGSWSDPVDYWMPFLSNQYGTYGFHDATWRAADSFGNIDPNSADASHGCVELPLGASQWLYNWSRVGTAVTIES